ncbi:MAG: barstar family protein [Planctomycetota bacterium]
MWPFDQPPNCATFTTRHVLRDRKPITRVVHDESDHGWQFLSDDGADMNSALLVCLSEVVKHDNTVLEIANLPPGWVATRTSVGGKWTRIRQYEDATRVFINWSKLKRVDDFFDAVFAQCGSPTCHGRNLDALADGWIAGGINLLDPPYVFVFESLGHTPVDLIPFRDVVMEIVRQSIDENGGRLETSDEQSNAPKAPVGRECES